MVRALSLEKASFTGLVRWRNVANLDSMGRYEEKLSNLLLWLIIHLVGLARHML